jgi:hypothetical protein
LLDEASLREEKNRNPRFSPCAVLFTATATEEGCAQVVAAMLVAVRTAAERCDKKNHSMGCWRRRWFFRGAAITAWATGCTGEKKKTGRQECLPCGEIPSGTWWDISGRFGTLVQPMEVENELLKIAAGFGCVIACGVLFGLAAYLFGLWRGPHAGYSAWTWAIYRFGIDDTWSFVRVAYIHNGS